MTTLDNALFLFLLDASHTDIPAPYNPSVVQIGTRLLQIRWTSPSDDVVGHEIKIMLLSTGMVQQIIDTG